MEFVQIVNKIKSNQNLKEFYSKNLSGKISPYISAILIQTKITPNQITLSMIPACLIACYFLQVGNFINFIYGSIFLFITNLIDTIDGEVARYKNITSNKGDYLDRISHYATYAFAIFFLSIGLYKIYDKNLLIIIIGFLSLSLNFIDEICRDLIITCNLSNNIYERKIEKAKTSLANKNYIKKIYNIFFSGMALFHLIGFFAAIDLLIFFFINKNFFLLSYFFLFLLYKLLKLVIRINIINKQYFN